MIQINSHPHTHTHLQDKQAFTENEIKQIKSIVQTRSNQNKTQQQQQQNKTDPKHI